MDYKVIYPNILVEKIEPKQDLIITTSEPELIEGKIIAVDEKNKDLLNHIAIFSRKYAKKIPNENNLLIITEEDILVYK